MREIGGDLFETTVSFDGQTFRSFFVSGINGLRGKIKGVNYCQQTRTSIAKDECCEDPCCIYYAMCRRPSAVLYGNNCGRDRDSVLEKRERED